MLNTRILGLTILIFWPLMVQGVPLPEMDCLIEPNALTDLSSSVNGVIEEIYVERGDKVKKGQKLIQLESSVEKANVALAKAKAEYTHDVKAAETQVAYTKKKLNRISTLYKKNALSDSEHQDAEHESNNAQIEKKKAQHAKTLADLELKRAQRALSRLTINSPMDGIVVERFMTKGEAVEDKKILSIAEVNPLKVEVIVPAQFFGEIKPGMKAHLVPEIMDSSVEAEVTLVDTIVDASSGTFYVRLRLPNPNQSLPGGLKCKVTFDNGEKPLKEVELPESPYGF